MPSSSPFDHLDYKPYPEHSILGSGFNSTNALTRSILNGLQPGKEGVPKSDILNPPLWEFGHLTWFHEFWVQRRGHVSNPSLLSNADYLFNSSDIAHDDRWQIDIPSQDTLLEYNTEVMNKTHQLLASSIDIETAYFMQLSIFHQDMHNEAFAYMWQTLGYAMPFEPFSSIDPAIRPSAQHIHFPASMLEVGSDRNHGFLFDNEKWQHEIPLPAFSISEQAVSNAEYREFIESSANQSAMPPAGVPSHWKKEDGVWYQRYFNQWRPMCETEPVRHISYIDAKRYCDCRQVRLPNEHELTRLMRQSPSQWIHSHLWEWTSSPFLPFPGFTPDPYQDYSQPSFDGGYQVLKGWSMFTPDRLRRPAFRNFYTPGRSDHFCGFRTCLL
jgi:ergothioneine biosynthesis protein EgtB